MNRFIKNKTLWLSVAFALFIGSTFPVHGQVYSKPTNPPPKPLLQNIEVQTTNPTPTSAPLVTKTGSSAPTTTRKTSIPVLADVEIPGYSGILVEDVNGNVVLDSYSNYAFNPASNVKIATAYAVLKTFGPDYRFPTNVWTDGQIDPATGTLYGNVYVSGRDLSLGLEQGITIAHELNRLGIQNVNGDLIVTGDFVMSQSSTAQRAGSLLSATLNSAKRNASANRAWQSFQVNSKRTDLVGVVPSVALSGGTYVQTIPTNARLLFSHESAPMREIVKATLCFSNNYLSEKLGDMLGGAYAVARIVQLNAQVAPEEFYLQTSSGLGTNRVTPQAMMRLLRTLRKELARNKMTFADIMPVAGIDRGTLEHRFDTDFSRGSIVGKTGTLGNTDGGVSTLAGEIQTRQGKLLFVIFNQRGGVNRFRSFQNMLVSMIQGQFGGATPLIYTEIPLDVRLAKTRIIYPTTRTTVNE